MACCAYWVCVIALYKNTITLIDLFNLLIQLISDPLSGEALPVAKQKAEFGVRLNQP